MSYLPLCHLTVPLLLALLVGSLGAQQVSAPLTKVEDILALAGKPLMERSTPVLLRGIVTDVSTKRREIIVHDGEKSISVVLGEETAPPVLGTEVEVEGRAYSELLNEKVWKRVEAAKVTVMDTKALPEPLAVTIPDVTEFNHLDQWVSLEGVVVQVRYSPPLLTVQLSADRLWCNVLVRNWGQDEAPKNWVGSTIRVTGVNHGITGTTLYVMMIPSPEQVTVLKPGFTDPFDAPATTAAALQRAGKHSSERYRLKGTVIDSLNGIVYVRDVHGGAFSVSQVYPLGEDKTGRLATPVELPRTCKPGDVVEVVGSPTYVDAGVHLNFAQIKALGTEAVPEPVATDIATVLSGKHSRDLVELHGRLVSLEDVTVNPTKWRATATIEDGGRLIVADLDSPKRGALTDLRPDHLVKIRAIVTGAPQVTGVRLWLPTPRDVQSLGVASDVMARRVWTWVGVTAACTIPLMVWILMLGRSRTAIRELNAGLEKRVDERTAELAAAKDDLSKALLQERDLNELKTRFISLVSHEFRTPLGITMSAVELLRHHGARLNAEKQRELLEDIHSSTLRMSGLMEQVLILGRVEAGKSAYHPVPVDLEELCGKLVDEGLSATNRRCPVTFHSEGDFTDAEADESLMRHIFSNLISNAVKYSPQDTPVELALHRENGHAVFTVKDAGIGIPEADRARLFEAFHRASNVGEVPGTGLGLLLVKRCVDLHQGSIGFESAVGKGTTFTVKLPVTGD